jgi:hypothetical protein
MSAFDKLDPRASGINEDSLARIRNHITYNRMQALDVELNPPTTYPGIPPTYNAGTYVNPILG